MKPDGLFAAAAFACQRLDAEEFGECLRSDYALDLAYKNPGRTVLACEEQGEIIVTDGRWLEAFSGQRAEIVPNYEGEDFFRHVFEVVANYFEGVPENVG